MKRAKKAKNYQHGGAVRGPGTATSDSILARVSNGEYILPAKAVPMVGIQKLEQARTLANFVGGARSPSAADDLRQSAGRFVDSAAQAGAQAGRMTPAGFGLRALVESPQAYAQSLDSPEAQQVMRENEAYRMMRGYALGGLVDDGLYAYDPIANSYASKNPGAGNDLSLANSMNAASDRMKAMREGPTATSAPSNPAQQNPMAGLASLMNPAQQAMDAYKTARSGADTLDVASGRFDREYVPRFSGGGTVGQEWERLPRFEQGGFNYSRIPIDPNQQRRLQEAAANAARNRINQMSAGNIPVESSYYGVGATPRPSVRQDKPKMIAPTAPAATPGNEWGSLQDKWGIERPQPGTLPAMQGESRPDPTAPTAPPAPSNYQDPRDFIAGNSGATGTAMRAAGYAPVANGPENYGIYARDSRPVGTGQYSSGLPFEPSQGYPALPAPNAMAGERRLIGPRSATSGLQYGGSDVPLYETQYQTPQGSMTITGPSRRVGGGSVSVMDQGNGGTVEGNVAAIERQIAAVQALNQARAGGGQQGGYGGLDAQDLMRMSNPFYAPGQSYGDEVMNRDRFMRQFPTKTGRGRVALANVEQNLGQEQAARMQGLAQIGQKGQPGISPYQMGQLANDRERLTLDRARYQNESATKRQEIDKSFEQKAFEAAMKMPQKQREEATNQLLAELIGAQKSGDKATFDRLKPLADMLLGYRGQPADAMGAWLQSRQQNP